MLKILRLNNSGVILVTVIILTFVLSIVVVSIVGLHVSQVKSSQSVVDQIKAEQLAVGAAYQAYQCKEWEGCSVPAAQNLGLDGKTFSVTSHADGTTSDGLDKYHFTVNY